MEKILLVINLLLYSFLLIFSYAYVDLNLTISQNLLVLKFVDLMQQLGYFHRPLATFIYLMLIIFTFSFFILNLWLFYKLKVSLTYLKVSTITSTLILIFAYPFLSSDLFNYMFDAKIILNYYASPYTHRPLDFPNDEWLRFMRWIHRYSPYGPLWLGMSLIPALLGFGKFILNFLAFKIFIGFFHLVNSFLVYKILSKINPKFVLLGTAFYSLNPLFLVEGVVNSHNDIVLATPMLFSIYFFVNKKIALSYIGILGGALIKYIPILNLPWFILLNLFTHRVSPVKHDELRSSQLHPYSHGENSTNDNFRRLVLLNITTMAIFTWLFSSFRITVPFVSAGATQVQFQPWYLFWTLPFVALLPNVRLMTVSIALAISASLRYLPYLYFGDWSHQGTIAFMQSITFIFPITAIIIIFLRKRFSK